jgi:elongation factor G
MSKADPALLEPIVHMEISVPEECVGDVIGDLSSRRGHPLGMEPKPGVTRIAAEVPMAEVLDYARDLRAITGGRGEYTVAFERYEELPAHLADDVAAAASAGAEQLVG